MTGGGRALAGAAAIALFSTAGGSAGFAQSADLLDCTTKAVTPAFRDKLADAMLADNKSNEALFEQLVTVSEQCATRHGLAADKGEAYFTYSVARLPRDVFVARLKAAGIAAQVVDDALDFGPGRSNPVISGDLSEAQLASLFAALGAAGVDVDAVPEASWEVVGAYAATSSLMWQNHAKLK